MDQLDELMEKLSNANETMNVNTQNLSNISNRLITKLNQTSKTKLHPIKTHQRLTDCAQHIIPTLEAVYSRDYEAPKKDATSMEEYIKCIEERYSNIDVECQMISTIDEFMSIDFN